MSGCDGYRGRRSSASRITATVRVPWARVTPRSACRLLVAMAVAVAVAAAMAMPALAGTLPNGYWINVDESGTTTFENLGLGQGSLQGSGQGNVNYGFAEECAPGEASGGPFSIGFYPPLA
jgi:hypothetical protein